MILKRSIVVVVMGSLSVIVSWLGGWWFFIPFALLLGISTHEFCRMSKSMRADVPTWSLLPLVALYWTAVQLNLNIQMVGIMFSMTLLVGVVITLWRYKKKRATLSSFSMILLGIFVFGWLGGHLFQIRLIPTPDAWQWAILSLGVTWLTDAGAYVTGKFVAGKGVIGRHALAPRISPAKSIEGYIGGLIVGLIVAVGVGVPVFHYSLLSMCLLGGLVGAISPLGDLSVSLLKRRANVKDAGKLLPGHGGALDRTDTLFVGIPLAFYIWRIVTHFGL